MQPVSQEQVPLDAGCPRCYSRFVLYEQWPDETHPYLIFDCHACSYERILTGIDAILMWSLLTERMTYPERFSPPDPRRN